MSFSEIWLFLQQGFLSGLVTGSVYALLAIAIVAIFKTTDVPNFAQGEIFMIGGYVALSLLLIADWSYAVVIPVTVVAVAVGAARRVRQHPGPSWARTWGRLVDRSARGLCWAR